MQMTGCGGSNAAAAPVNGSSSSSSFYTAAFLSLYYAYLCIKCKHVRIRASVDSPTAEPDGRTDAAASESAVGREGGSPNVANFPSIRQLLLLVRRGRGSVGSKETLS